MNEKNTQLDRLINCLTSVLALQSCGGYKEIPGADNPISFKNESMVLLRNVLAESLKSLGNYFSGFDPSCMWKKPITNLPHAANDHSAGEDLKEEKSLYDSDIHESFCQANLLSPDRRSNAVSESGLMSPFDPLNSSDPGMAVDPVPSYFNHDDMKLQFTKVSPSSEIR
eukprot:TRINITY_DN6217_c0_g2_i2.p1 TRINITY_DN6217_c0_g2~~TRINITY_DN6217_c0_g2_i2.p1  ORF type:complete len:169 (-),score=29.97 TRINITY_DN6217_c0_g2_i2:119-625(-)